MQIEGVDFNETWVPVLKWYTVRLMLIIKCILGLDSFQANITCEFLNAELDKDGKIFVQMPQGFKLDGKVLKL